MDTYTTRLTRLAETLEALPPRIEFDMTNYIVIHECGTAACIAGVAALLADPKWRPSLNDGQCGQNRTHRFAANWLDLDPYTAYDLFLPAYPDDIEPSDVTSAHAAQVVRNYIATNRVDWEPIWKQIKESRHED